ncbi:MAG: FHA domain-containing protein [Polyangiaceae bacterium]
MTAWLKDRHGVRIQLSSAGVTLGRDSTCSIVLSSPFASRRHALVTHGKQGTQIFCLGRHGVQVNERPVQIEAWLQDGDVLELPGARFSVEIEPASSSPGPWLLETDSQRYRVLGPIFSIGGGAKDQLNVSGWPPGALVLTTVDRGLVGQATAAIEINGRAVVEDELISMDDRDEISYAGTRLRLLRDGKGIASTSGIGEHFPSSVDLEFLPNGGLLRICLDDEYRVFLADRRCDLIASLLRPPAPAKPGDWVSDAQLIPMIWHGDGATRVQLNTLIHRTRQTLTQAGVDGSRLVERARGGRGTRFLIGPATLVSVL